MKNFRFYALFIIFVILYSALGANLYKLQISKGAEFSAKADILQERGKELTLRRGQIFITDKFDTNIPIALNKDAPIIFVSPAEIKDPKMVSEEVGQALGIDPSLLEQNINANSGSYFFSLIDKANEEQVNLVSEKKFPGVHIEQKQYRSYPYDNLASQVTGYVGKNDKNPEPAGIYGIERFYNKELSNGDDVYLTIDRNIQSHAEQILSKYVEKFQATGGTVIVEDPKTGKIIALASKPDFDPNEYGKANMKDFANPAIQAQYEPGSVFKPLTMSAGIDRGAFTPDTTFVDKGFVTLNGKTIHNANSKIYGKVTMTGVIENSINTGAVYAEQLIGHNNFYEYLKKFGFTEKTGISLPEEIAGNIRNLERKDARAIDFATVAFGQGAAVTPLQLINSFSVLANGGLLMEPHINKNEEPYVLRRVISEDTAKKVTAMIETTVEKAKIATISQYRVAGKTGTAYIPEKGKYSEEMVHTFVGFAPVSNPQFVVLMKLDRPQIGELAGLTVVPAFRELSEFILNYYNIPPDKVSVVQSK